MQIKDLTLTILLDFLAFDPIERGHMAKLPMILCGTTLLPRRRTLPHPN